MRTSSIGQRQVWSTAAGGARGKREKLAESSADEKRAEAGESGPGRSHVAPVLPPDGVDRPADLPQGTVFDGLHQGAENVAAARGGLGKVRQGLFAGGVTQGVEGLGRQHLGLFLVLAGPDQLALLPGGLV